jgi:hypothetical protein
VVGHELSWCDSGWKLGLLMELKEYELSNSPLKHMPKLTPEQFENYNSWNQKSTSSDVEPKSSDYTFFKILEKIGRMSWSLYQLSAAFLLYTIIKPFGKNNFI